ncbi:MAG: addiction module protein [Spirochaetota bacterium]
MANTSAGYGTVFEKALALPSLEKAALIEKLFESFGDADRASLDAEWEKESESRLAAYLNGEIKSVAEDEVFERLA